VAAEVGTLRQGAGKRSPIKKKHTKGQPDPAPIERDQVEDRKIRTCEIEAELRLFDHTDGTVKRGVGG